MRPFCHRFPAVGGVLLFALFCAAALEITTANAATVTGPAPPTLGNYPDRSLPLSTNTTVTPDAPPTNTTSLTVSTSINFQGKLEGYPPTGVLRVTDAHPAGTYTIAVKAFDASGLTTTRTFTLTVTTPNACTPVFFAPATNLYVGSVPRQVVVGDFNGDGKQDLAGVNQTGNDVSLLLGNGAGSFGAASFFSAGGGVPVSLAVGDFNGDGHQDLVVANAGTTSVSIMLGNGAGGFALAGTFIVSSNSMEFVTVGDFNRDGRQDIVTANTYTQDVSVLLGDGTGNFASASHFGTGLHPLSIAVADFNGDGNQDLATANSSSNNVSILLGDGAGHFSAPTNYSVGPDPRSVAAGDFNGDGHQDLAVANGSSNNASILLGDGAGHFSAPTNFAVDNGASCVAVGDLNGDGKPDLAVTNGLGLVVSTLLGDGTGHFGTPTHFFVGYGPDSVAVGDFNGDGRQDLAASNYSSNDVSVLLRLNCPTPTPSPSCAPVITQSFSHAIPDHITPCMYPHSPFGHMENSYWRAFDMQSFVGGSQYDVSSVTFGAGLVNVTQQVIVRLYTNTGGAFPNGTRSLIGSSTITVTSAQQGTLVTAPLVATVPAGTPELVMELFTPNGAGGRVFYAGANLAPQTGPSYWSAPCNAPTPVPIYYRLVFDINGSCPEAPTPTPSQTPTPTPSPTPTSSPTPTPPPPTIVVTTINDSGPGSLRQALADAHNGDIIGFDPALNGQTISPTSGELVIDQDISISGPGSDLLTVSRSGGPQAFRIIHIMPSHTVAIQGLTISGGSVQKFDPGPGAGIFNEQGTLTIDSCTVSANNSFYSGGGIYNNGTLTVSHSTIIGNFSGFSGGGIYNSGTLTIMNSTVRNNTSGLFPGVGGGTGLGAGIYNAGMAAIVSSTIDHNTANGGNQGSLGGGVYSPGAGPLTVSNSTISQNAAFIQGGAIYGGGSITNCTISGNTAAQGGGIYVNTALEIGNTILNAGANGANIHNDGGTVTSHGYNLSSDSGGGFLAAPGDQINTDPMLGPLQDNGGPTLTHDLLTGSQAINAGHPNFTPPPDFDQRGPGYPRVFNGRLDIGSFELQVVAPTPTPTPVPAQLLNLSTRMLVQTADSVGIGGFIITGSTQKQVLLRGIGPSLAQSGVPNALADPVMELHGPTGFTTIVNDNWRDTQEELIIATGLAPINDLESAILVTVDPGAYTAIVKGKNDTSGVGLVEVYDLGPATSQLGNISTRAFVGTGANVVIGGFILGAGDNSHVFIRALSLTGFGINPALADPTLELRDSDGTLLAVNDNCGASPFPPGNPLDACIDISLPPGAYTAILAGKNGSTGIGLVEIYNLN